jgi:hypothetical protein
LILYDQNSQFLGLGSYELVLLGFEDMAEFCRYHQDFKELLVEEEGYICASTAFSWLDFLRYSGAPDKKILIQTHEDGKRIEAGIKISEIHLKSSVEEPTTLYYALELTKPPHQKSDESDNAPRELPLDPFEYHSIDQIRLEDFDFEIPDKKTDPLYNFALCAQKLGIDLHTMSQKVETYLASLDETVAYIDTLVQKEALQEARKELKNLKNTTRELRIASLYRPLQTIEALIGHSNEPLYIEALLNLRAAIKSFKEQLA